jgi:hypothetical protein
MTGGLMPSRIAGAGFFSLPHMAESLCVWKDVGKSGIGSWTYTSLCLCGIMLNVSKTCYRDTVCKRIAVEIIWNKNICKKIKKIYGVLSSGI